MLLAQRYISIRDIDYEMTIEFKLCQVGGVGRAGGRAGEDCARRCQSVAVGAK